MLNGKTEQPQLIKNEFSSSKAGQNDASYQDESLQLLNGVAAPKKRLKDKSVPISSDKLELLETERVNY